MLLGTNVASNSQVVFACIFTFPIDRTLAEFEQKSISWFIDSSCLEFINFIVVFFLSFFPPLSQPLVQQLQHACVVCEVGLSHAFATLWNFLPKNVCSSVFWRRRSNCGRFYDIPCFIVYTRSEVQCLFHIFHIFIFLLHDIGIGSQNCILVGHVHSVCSARWQPWGLCTDM